MNAIDENGRAAISLGATTLESPGLNIVGHGAVLFFQLINARHERASTVLTEFVTTVGPPGASGTVPLHSMRLPGPNAQHETSSPEVCSFRGIRDRGPARGYGPSR